MYRTHTCGELRLKDAGKVVQLAGWVQRSRDLGGMTFVDLRDRYGITQLVFNMETSKALCEQARKLGREDVITVSGTVAERQNKNPKLPTGEIEIIVDSLEVLNPSKVPPFLIEDETDGGEDLRMKFRYLDLRRNPLKHNLIHRHQVNMAVREYLNSRGFIDIETPFLIKSTPEGARDFVVPSRLNPGQFYALPQSPQTFKQLLMVAGYDKYYQIVKCFRDEDLRADRQPEFTQIDCEMSFVTRDDIINEFNGLIRHVLKKIKGIDCGEIELLAYDEALRRYGTDKPDLRFGMELFELNHLVKGKGFNVFDKAGLVAGICVPGGAAFTRKQIDSLTEFVKRPQVGAGGLIYVRYQPDGSFKSSVDKFFNAEDFQSWAKIATANPGDLLLIIAGETAITRNALGLLRLELGEQLGLRDPGTFRLAWIVDFPLLEWDTDENRWVAMHHPFTRPRKEDIKLLDSDPGAVRADAYDLVLNGNEIAGGSIRIHERPLQEKIFDILGLSRQEAEEKFGFLMRAFEFGAPPHGGIAFGFDRLVALLAGAEVIRDFIAFPKNNHGRDVMLDAPAPISKEQLDELGIMLKPDTLSKTDIVI